MQPKVSIIVPVFNSEQYVASAISRVKEQTYPNIEIIIVDDASTDSSFQIAKTFESETCKVIRQPNSGAAVARNTGLANATGRYIQFLDIDDFLSDDKIEKQVIALESQNNKIAVCNYVEFLNESELHFKHLEKDQASFIYSSDSPADFLINLYGGNGTSNFIQTNSWLVPRHLIDKVGGWRNYRCPDDDGEFFARVILASEGIVYVPGVYNFYRRSAEEAKLSNNTNKKYLQNSLLTIDLKYQYLLQFSDSKVLRRAMATQYLRFAIFSFPKQKALSDIAYKRYKSLNMRVSPPLLGGKLIELVKKTLGWKAARLVKFYLREKQ